jgi:hypothetical protein
MRHVPGSGQPVAISSATSIAMADTSALQLATSTIVASSPNDYTLSVVNLDVVVPGITAHMTKYKVWAVKLFVSGLSGGGEVSVVNVDKDGRSRTVKISHGNALLLLSETLAFGAAFKAGETHMDLCEPVFISNTPGIAHQCLFIEDVLWKDLMSQTPQARLRVEPASE